MRRVSQENLVKMTECCGKQGLRVNFMLIPFTQVEKTTRGNTCAQIFVSDKGFVVIDPMRSRRDFIDALHLFCKENSIPPTIVMDPAGEQKRNDVRKFLYQVGSTPRCIKENTQWSNRDELYVGLFKESICKDLVDSNSPMKL